jgi:hypothetical protein
MAGFHPIAISESDAERFWRSVEKRGSCWIWTGTINLGYGTFQAGGKSLRAHRVAWVLVHRRPIPDGLSLDHICRVRSCVNPDHLEPVTTRINVLRGIGVTAINARKTHCRRGHPLELGNLFYVRGMRQCVKCEAIRARRKYDNRVKAGRCLRCSKNPRAAHSRRYCAVCLAFDAQRQLAKKRQTQ